MAQLRKYYEEIIGMSLRSIDFTLPVPVPDEEKKLTLILFPLFFAVPQKVL